MSTVIRSKISIDNQFYISKYRYLELKNFCLQYDEWDPDDYRRGLLLSAIRELDGWIQNYILEAVTKGKAFPYLKTLKQIPCERDLYYKNYRKFFYLLSRKEIEQWKQMYERSC